MIRQHVPTKTCFLFVYPHHLHITPLLGPIQEEEHSQLYTGQRDSPRTKIREGGGFEEGEETDIEGNLHNMYKQEG